MASLSKRRFDHIQHPHPHSPAPKRARASFTQAQDHEVEFPPWEEMFLEPLPFPSFMFDDVESKAQALTDFTAPPLNNHNHFNSRDLPNPRNIELSENSIDACG
jgi:hypothetical protein